ncbi:hypothetical protein Ga0123462_0979 [Mariprofundus ferrinatatus]|uniref:Outer membrane protein n=1 Tax=Mariprofundus ferrinatatus TaxID=1921087 RepID=A0A2K8L3D6_9PROT|nr:hypothetical protein [Mariprofundus ferrinatatus]ATX81848.1 hypothetical protein Ga0123462_0979 [Mariprofundus ferrinatatus]
MKLKILAALSAMMFGFANHAYADETVAIKVGYMVLSPSGQFAASAINAGTRVDMETDLGLKNSKQPTGEVIVNLGDSALSLGFVPMTFSGTAVLNRNITYNGQNYAAGSTVSSDFKADMFDIGYTYYFINMDDLPSRFQLGVETSLKTITAKTSITSAGVTTSRNATVPIPTLGLRGRVALADFVGVAGRVGYLGYSGNSILDADAQVEFSPLPTLGIYAGYRQLKLKIDSNSVYVNTTFSGPYAGAFFRF